MTSDEYIKRSANVWQYLAAENNTTVAEVVDAFGFSCILCGNNSLKQPFCYHELTQSWSEYTICLRCVNTLRIIKAL